MPHHLNSKDKSEKARHPVYMTPAHLRNPSPEGHSGCLGGVVRSACLSEASCAEDSDRDISAVGWSIRAAVSYFRLLLLDGARRNGHGSVKSPFAEKVMF